MRLFGLDVDAPFEIAGVPEDDAPAAGRPVALRLARRSELFGTWPRSGTEPLTFSRDENGRRLHAVDRHPTEGILMRAKGWGVFRISAPADALDCAPLARSATWRWQRYLIGQALPYVSLLRGHEVWHASAVAIGDRAVALVGASGAGKSTLAATLIGRGHELLADDVVALRRSGDEVCVEPGPGLLSLRPGAIADLQSDALGERIGGDEDGSRIATPRRPSPSNLATVVLLDRRREDPGGARLETEPPDPRLLLGATFNFVERSPDRLVRMLDICSAISRTVPIRRLVLGRDATPAAAADAVEGGMP